jgi:hypothetical protein
MSTRRRAKVVPLTKRGEIDGDVFYQLRQQVLVV